MMTEKLQKELNVQINAEMWSSNLYLSMAFLLKKVGNLFGFLITPPIFAKKYQRNDNECYNS